LATAWWARRHSDHPSRKCRSLWGPPLIPPAKPGGRPRKWPMCKVLNAVFYLLSSGCQWRMPPREFPPWSTVHHYFRVWRLDGTWEKINAVLRGKMRVRRGRDPNRAPESSTPNR